MSHWMHLRKTCGLIQERFGGSAVLKLHLDKYQASVVVQGKLWVTEQGFLCAARKVFSSLVPSKVSRVLLSIANVMFL